MAGRTSDRRDAMQRVRIGLTGLAGVLVLVLFAASVLGLRSADSGVAPAAGRAAPPAHAIRETPKDPLAELGVTPGGSASDAAAPTRRPAPAAAPAPAGRTAAPARPGR